MAAVPCRGGVDSVYHDGDGKGVHTHGESTYDFLQNCHMDESFALRSSATSEQFSYIKPPIANLAGLPAELVARILGLLLVDEAFEWVPDLGFSAFLKTSRGMRNSCRRLYHSSLHFMAECIAKDPIGLSVFRVVEYELSVEKLATFKAIVSNPVLASLIDEIRLDAYEPPRLLAHEQAYKNALRQDWEYNGRYRQENFESRTEFEIQCAIHVHWLDVRERFLEASHILKRGHDLRILQLAEKRLTALKRFRFRCLRGLTQCRLSMVSSPPDFRNTIDRKPIRKSLVGLPIQYRGLANFARVFSPHKNFQAISLSYIDLRLAQLTPSDLFHVGNLLKSTNYLTLKFSYDKDHISGQRRRTSHVNRCRDLFSDLRELQGIRLEFQHDHDSGPKDIEVTSQLLETLLHDVRFPKIRGLYLKSTYTSLQGLRQFLQGHKQILEEVIINANVREHQPSAKGLRTKRLLDAPSRSFNSRIWDRVLGDLRSFEKLKGAELEDYNDFTVHDKVGVLDYLKFTRAYAQLWSARGRFYERDEAKLYPWFVDI